MLQTSSRKVKKRGDGQHRREETQTVASRERGQEGGVWFKDMTGEELGNGGKCRSSGVIFNPCKSLHISNFITFQHVIT